jgi:hypothetical protein
VATVRSIELIRAGIAYRTVAHLPDDRVGVAGLSRDGLGQQILGGGGTRAWQRERVVVIGLDGLGKRAEAHQHEYPGRDDREPVAETPPCDGRHDSEMSFLQ